MATYPANGSYVDTWDAALLAWLTDTVFDTDGSFKAESEPTFAGLNLSGLTANRLLAGNADKDLVSTDLASWIAGTANQVNVTNGGDGTVTLSGPQNLHTSATPEFSALTLSSTSTPLYAGPWTGRPEPIAAHCNIYGDLFCGNVGENVGRFRVSSNASNGFLQWNRYYDGTASQQMDVTKPSFSFELKGGADAVTISRSDPGSTTMVTLFELNGATGKVTIGDLLADDIVADSLVIDSTTLIVDAVDHQVGIGTTPQRLFHLAEEEFPYMHFTDDVSGHGASDGMTVGMRGGTSVTAFIRVREDRPFSIWTDDAERLTVLGNGNIGINTTSANARLDVRGNTRLGDGNTNYAEIKADGEINLHGTARVKQAIWIDSNGIKAPGSKPATEVAHGDLEVAAWQFADESLETNQQSVSWSCRIPEPMDRTVAPTITIAWSADGVSPGNCEWQLEYFWTAPGEDTTQGAEETLTQTAAASSTAHGMVITTFTGINVPGGSDVCLHCRLTRLSAGTNDTIADTVELHGTCFQFTCDKLGEAT